MGEIIKMRRKPRPLRKTYDPRAPYTVIREDQDDGSITFHVADERPDSFRDVCSINDYIGGHPYAKTDAEQIAKGLNMLVQYGMEKLPNVTPRGGGIDDFDLED